MATKWTQEIVEARLLPALKELGSGYKQIAQSFKDMGLKGESGDASECVVAKFVQKLFRTANVSVDYEYANVGFGDEQEFSVLLPKAVSKFIEEFDDEKFEELEMTAKDFCKQKAAQIKKVEKKSAKAISKSAKVISKPSSKKSVKKTPKK
jgi:hypothetical protein